MFSLTGIAGIVAAAILILLVLASVLLVAILGVVRHEALRGAKAAQTRASQCMILEKAGRHYPESERHG